MTQQGWNTSRGAVNKHPSSLTQWAIKGGYTDSLILHVYFHLEEFLQNASKYKMAYNCRIDEPSAHASAIFLSLCSITSRSELTDFHHISSISHVLKPTRYSMKNVWLHTCRVNKISTVTHIWFVIKCLPNQPPPPSHSHTPSPPQILLLFIKRIIELKDSTMPWKLSKLSSLAHLKG